MKTRGPRADERLIVQFVVALIALIIVAVPGPASAAASDFAPVDRPGPALRPTTAALGAAVTCSGNFRNGKEPVLLIPGTAFTAKAQFAWSWQPALTRAGIPWCAVTPPENSLGDLSIAGEYDTYAIRKTYELAGRKIAVVGHSQGAMRPRWALRFWPDTRVMVADMVSVAPDNQGVSLNAPALAPALMGTTCSLIGCPQGIWQQLRGSQFMQAINSGQETFPGVDYSVIYSETDGVVAPPDTVLHPAAGTSYRRTSIQSICPGRLADHLTNGSVDAVSWAMVADAITNPGPVEGSRIDLAVCGQAFLPGQDPIAALTGAVNAPLQIANAAATTPRATAEAALPCYVHAAGCP